MRIVWFVLAAMQVVGCGRTEETAQPAAPPPATPIRGAAGDTDLRVMLAEIVAAHACERIENRFLGLRGEKRKDLTTGTLWLRECTITNRGTNVTLVLGGQGWQWTEKKEEKAGAEFEVRDYVKFAVKATVRGSLDIGYEPGTQIASVWFSPARAPDVKFTPLGDIPVDEKGLWSSIVGGAATVAAESPEEQSKEQAETRGEQAFEKQLAQGMTVAIDLCTGYQRFSLGRPQRGELGPPDPGESKQQPIEIQPGGLLVFGPYDAPHGMSIGVTSSGPIRVGLACIDKVGPAAQAFIAERRAPTIPTLAQRDVAGKATLAVGDQSCKLAVVVRSLAQQPVTFDWQRPASEIARSTGGPVIHCERKQTVDSERDGSAGRAAARRR